MAKILVVDDNVDLLRLIELKLAQEGYNVALSDNGSGGLENITRFNPDAIILDIMMPDIDGWEFCRRAREITHVPIIMLTARNADQDIIKGLSIGADDYVTKPFPLSTLSARIEALLRRQAWDEADAAEDVEALKSNIVSALSQELRTPIALILNALDLSLREYFRNDIEAQQQFIRDARQNAETLRWLIEDLLLMVRIDEGLEVLVRPSMLEELIRQTIQQSEAFCAARDLKVRVVSSADIPAHVDQVLIRHALHHLLVFTLNQAPERSQITIFVERSADGPAHVDFHAQDAGIPQEYAEKIFERFYQLPDQQHWKQAGIGAGLYISRAIAKAHGGDLHLLNENDNGSTFRLSIPVEQITTAN